MTDADKIAKRLATRPRSTGGQMKIPESVKIAVGVEFYREREEIDPLVCASDALTAALAEWERRGMVMVPKEPTEKMSEAGADTYAKFSKDQCGAWLHIDPIYRAMIAAGEEK